MMCKILLHIGYAKAGSTFLQEFYRKHPQMLWAPNGIAVYEIIEWAANKHEQMPKYYVMSDEDLGAGWAIIESSPSMALKYKTYLGAFCPSPNKVHFDCVKMSRCQAKICDLLHDLFPNSRVLILTRGFKTILGSAYSEYVKDGGYLTFGAFLQTYQPLFLRWLDINYLISTYTAAFGNTNVIVLPFELLRDDPMHLLTLIENKLCLDHCNIDPGHLNQALLLQELYWYATISRLIVAPIADKLGNKTAGKLFGHYANYWVQPNRLRRLIKILDALFGRKVSIDKIPDGYIDAFKGKATILSQYPPYKEYLAEYLLDG